MISEKIKLQGKKTKEDFCFSIFLRGCNQYKFFLQIIRLQMYGGFC